MRFAFLFTIISYLFIELCSFTDVEKKTVTSPKKKKKKPSHLINTFYA